MIEKIALLADSACDLPQALIKQYNIRILPLKILYPGKEFSDRIDIQPDDVYSRMPNEIPKTSMPSLSEIKNTLNEIKSECFSHLIAMHLSSNLSGTYQTVAMAAKEIEGMTIKVIDTRTLSMGTGWMVLDTARSIAQGLSYEKIIANINSLRKKVSVYYILETLEYLRRGGRIGQVAGMLGQFLHLKPVISVDDQGKYYTYAKTKGRKKSIEKLIDIVEEAIKDKPIKLAIMHGGAKEEFDRMVERLKNLPNITELICSDISPTLGVHTGPGLLGVSFFEE